MASETNVWSSAADNTYQAVTTNNVSTDVSTNEQHTRIYEYLSTTIKLDEMSIPLHDDVNSNSEIDASTGQHKMGTNENNSPFTTSGNNSPSKEMTVGVTYPLLRINDHYYTDTDIKYFSLSCVGLIPQIEVRLSCHFNDALKSNTIKEGDICSVFINPGHGSIKYYRGDFQITEAKTKDIDQTIYSDTTDIHFLGELFIPLLYDGSATFEYSGTSRDALIDVATKLGLGFYFSDPENTEDIQCWYCMSDGEQKTTGESPVIQYIKNCASHAWKNFDSFYDCWIDPRYAITFVNIAQMLGGTGLDEEIDMAVFNTNMSSLRGVNGENIDRKDEEKKAHVRPQPKLITNMVDGKMSLTAFQANSYKEMSDMSASRTLGLTNNNYYDSNNVGIQSVDEGQISMEYSIPVNADKLKNGFYIMAGPGKNLTYTQGDNGSFPDQHKSVQGGQISDTQSDEDAASITQTGNNMLASGNTNKFYETGEAHNLLNNSWLNKKYIQVRLNGINMQMMRGEKIPMLLLDYHNPQTNYMGTKNEGEMLYKKIAINCTGWFIIRNIKWIYDQNNLKNGTQWETVIEVSRREWPIPGYVKNSSTTAAAETTVENNIEKGTVNEAAMDQQKSTADSSSNIASTGKFAEAMNEKKAANEINTNGLKDFMITLYNDIKETAEQQNMKVKLISGRRWAADENDAKLEGAPVVQNGDTWKFINANGDVVWYMSKTSRHIYGEAFDIINGEGTAFKDLGIMICTTPKILVDMFTNGVYLMIETTADDLGTGVQHYHLGTVDQNNSESINGQKAFWAGIIAKRGTNMLSYNNQTYNLSQYLTAENNITNTLTSFGSFASALSGYFK